MGSLFSGPSTSSGGSKAAQKKAAKTAKKAANDLKSQTKQSTKNINAATDAASAGLTNLQNSIPGSLQPTGFNAGGINASVNNGVATVTTDPARQALVDQLQAAYNNAASAFGDVRSQWTPGESALRAAQLQQIENARQANASNLRESLAKRAVLGSSFGQDALTRANLDFNQQKDNVIAQTYLQELDAQHQLIGDQYTAAANAASSGINELNLQGNVGANLSSQANDLMKQAAQLQAQVGVANAQLKVQGATSAGQLGVQGFSNAGGLLTNTANNNANLATQQGVAQAQLDAQAQAGAGQLLGSIALAPITGGGSLLGLGASSLFPSLAASAAGNTGYSSGSLGSNPSWQPV